MTPQEKLIGILHHYLNKWKEMTQPFVWRLMITYEDFKQAQEIVEETLTLTRTKRFPEFLEKPEYADTLLIMAGEWYKRYYTGEGSLPEWIKVTDFESLWKNSSLRFPEKWVYQFDNGNKSWQYSAFVLGGLACSWQNEALIKTLLEFFNGENEDEIVTDSIDEGAVALRRSIEKKGSIYHFFREIINRKSEVRKFYDADTQPPVREFSSRIDREVKNVTDRKISVEWRYLMANTYSNEIYKTLQLHICPENYNDKPTYYVSLEKMKEWGFTDVDKIAEVEIFIRFYHQGYKTGDEIKVATLLTTGKSSAGFIIEDHSSSPLPALPYEFDSWEIIGETGNKSKVLFQKKDILPFDAVYQMAADPGAWSTRWRKGRAAIIFNKNCRIIDPQDHSVVGKQLIVNENTGTPVYWADIPVYVKVLYTDSEGNEHTKRIENPLAEAEVVIMQKPFTNLFEYFETNKIRVIERDPSGEETITFLPLLYGIDGVALKVSTDNKNFYLIENKEDKKELDFEYRQRGAIVEESELKEGILDIIVKGADQSAEVRVWYIPKKDKHEAPVQRDLVNEKVIWSDETSKHIEAEDTDIVEIYERPGGNNETAIFPVYRPWNHIYIFLDGKKVSEHRAATPLSLGLLNLADISLGVLDEEGYKLWNGRQHMDDFKSLTLSLATDSKQAKDIKNVVVRNYNGSLPPENESITIGNWEMQTDPEIKLWAPPKYYENKKDDGFDPLADDSDNSDEVIDPKLAIRDAIENNLHIFIFNKFFNNPELIKDLLKYWKEELGEEYFFHHRKTIERILWENNITDFKCF